MEDELFEALGRRRRKRGIEPARRVRNQNSNPDPTPVDDGDLLGTISEFGADRRIVRPPRQIDVP